MVLFAKREIGGNEPISEALRKKRAFCAYLDQRGSYYKEVDDHPTMIKMNYGGGDFVFSLLTASIDFDPCSNGVGDQVHVLVPCIARFPEEAHDRGLELCNKISLDKRWVRAYIDDNGELNMDSDMYITGGEFVESVRSLVATMMSVINEIYAEVQQAQWAEEREASVGATGTATHAVMRDSDVLAHTVTEDTVTRYATCVYDPEGNLISEGFGFVDRNVAVDPDDLWESSEW